MAAEHCDSEFKSAAARDSAALTQAWLDGEADARMICADDLTLLWANRAARAEMAGNFDLIERDGAILVLNRIHQAGLAAFVAQARADMTTFSFPRENGDGHILFRAQRIEHQRARCVGLSFNQTGSEFRVLFVELITIFRFTAAEHRVLDQMVDGNTAGEIAGILRISLDTIRSHIRHIYQKLEVTSREEMFCRLSPYRL